MDVKPFAAAFRDTNRRLFKLLDFLSALRGLASLNVHQPDENTLIEGALRSLVENQDFERCSVYLLQGKTLVNAAGMDWFDLVGDERPKSRSSLTFQLGEGMIGAAAAEGSVQHCRDTTTDQRFIQAPGAGGNRVGSLICVPMRFGDDILGVLNVSHPEPNTLDDTHVRMLVLFTDFLAQMLTNWRIVHRMEEEVSARTAAMETALEEAEEHRLRYERLAVVDELTQTHNRRFFFPEAQAAVARAVRHGHEFSLLMIDLDHFKHINDDLGHAAGDEALRQFAGMLRELTREGDILARFGGEEFVIALPNTTVEGAVGLAERLRTAMADHHWDLGNSHVKRITASIGISDLAAGDFEAGTKPRELVDLLLRNADIALYHSKDTGRDRCTVYQRESC